MILIQNPFALGIFSNILCKSWIDQNVLTHFWLALRVDPCTYMGSESHPFLHRMPLGIRGSLCWDCMTPVSKWRLFIALSAYWFFSIWKIWPTFPRPFLFSPRRLTNWWIVKLSRKVKWKHSATSTRKFCPPPKMSNLLTHLLQYVDLELIIDLWWHSWTILWPRWTLQRYSLDFSH